MKRIAYIIMTLVFTAASSLLAQNKDYIDSLKSELQLEGMANRIETYSQIAWEYRKSFPDSTLYYSKKAADLAQNSQEYRHLIVKPLNFTGVGYYYKGDNLNAFDYYQIAKDSALVYGDSLQYGYALNNIGRLYFNQGNYISAYDYFFRALEVFEIMEDKTSMSYGYKSLSELYQSQNNFEKALEMSLKTADIRQDFDDPSGIISIYLEIAGIYVRLENYNNGLSYFTKAYEIAESINDRANLAIIKLAIADMNSKRGQFNIAYSNAMEALKFTEGSQNINLLIKVYALLGEIYFYKNDFFRAKEYFKKVSVLASENNDITYDRDAYFFLSRIYEKEGNINAAYSNFKNYTDLKEKTENVNTAREIERLEARIALEVKETENKLLKINQETFEEVIKKQRSLNIALSAIFFLTLILLIIIWITAVRRRKHNKVLHLKNLQIEDQQKKITLQNKEIKQQNAELIISNKELDDLNNEKDSLLSLVAHDMKAPFHRIQGLTELLRLSGLNEEQMQYVTMIRNNSKHGAHLINDILDVNSMTIDKEKPTLNTTDLKKTLEDVVANFIVELTNKEIECKIACEAKLLVRTDINYLNRILENLISNAVKFSDLGSEIILKAGVSKDNFWISVKDFAQGFSEADKVDIFKRFQKLSARPTGGESSNGLGLAIVKTLVDRLNGKIDLDSEKGKYSEFTLYFPFLEE